MKECPFKIEDCEQCRWNFGHEKCGIFSIAADMSALVEESIKQTELLKKIFNKERRKGEY
jgi:hypothetical protein